MFTLDEDWMELDVSWVEVGKLRIRENALRRNERILSRQIEKLGAEFTKTLNARQRVEAKADELERKLVKVNYLKSRKSNQPRTPKQLDSAVFANAVSLAAAGHLEEALRLIKTVK
jgi:hypothetical protein